MISGVPLDFSRTVSSRARQYLSFSNVSWPETVSDGSLLSEQRVENGEVPNRTPEPHANGGSANGHAEPSAFSPFHNP